MYSIVWVKLEKNGNENVSPSCQSKTYIFAKKPFFGYLGLKTKSDRIESKLDRSEDFGSESTFNKNPINIILACIISIYIKGMVKVT